MQHNLNFKFSIQVYCLFANKHGYPYFKLAIEALEWLRGACLEAEGWKKDVRVVCLRAPPRELNCSL